jgi:chromate transporter
VRLLDSALSAIAAAVVGAVLNLAVWFGIHVLFPQPHVFNWFALAVDTRAFTGMVKWKWDIMPVVVIAGFAGLPFKTLLHL